VATKRKTSRKTSRKSSRKKAPRQRVWTVSTLRKSAVAEVRSFARLARAGRLTKRDVVALKNAMGFIKKYGTASDKAKATATLNSCLRYLTKRPKRSR
jgi:hypothetical protein